MATEQPPDDQMLRRLERRLNEASAAAERLIAEAAAATLSGGQRATGDPVSGEGDPDGRPPHAGWQAPRDDRPGPDGDAELIADVLQRLRGLIPPELQQRIAEALRELLLALRALLDWYIDRLERRRSEPAEVTDIPIT